MHESAADVALMYGVAGDPEQLGRHLDAAGHDARKMQYVRDLLVLLARVDPDGAVARCEALRAATGADDDLTGEQKRAWHAVALQGQLEAAGANVLYGTPLSYADKHSITSKAIEPLTDVRRAVDVFGAVHTNDIGRYFSKQATPEQAARDVAALRAIGADAMADALQEAIDAVGLAGTTGEWRDRVEAVRALGDAEVNRLTAALQGPPDDLFVLILEHQLRHAPAIRELATRVDALLEQEADRGQSKGGRVPRLDTDLYLTFLSHGDHDIHRPLRR